MDNELCMLEVCQPCSIDIPVYESTTLNVIPQALAVTNTHFVFMLLKCDLFVDVESIVEVSIFLIKHCPAC